MKRFLLVLLGFWIGLSALQAQNPGDLDLSFNTGGEGLGTGANSLVYSTLVDPNGKIIVFGSFTIFNGVPKNRIVRLNIDGSIDNSFNSGLGANGDIYKAIFQLDGKIIISGFFTSYNGVPRFRLARINSDGSLDESFNTEVIGVESIAEQNDGKILISGSFSSVNGQSINRVARLNSDGSLDESFSLGIGPNNTVNSLALQQDGKILIGGFFTSVNGVSKNHIARLDSDGSLDQSFNIGGGFNNAVRNITIQSDGKILVFGDFNEYNGVYRNRVIRINPNGIIDENFISDSNSTITIATLQSDGKILIGGSFSTINGVDSNRLARLNPDGGLDESFVSKVGNNSTITSISIQSNGEIILGGGFRSYDQVNRDYITRLDQFGDIDLTFNQYSGPSDIVRVVKVQSDGKLLIGGDFLFYSGVQTGPIVRLNNDGTLDSAFQIDSFFGSVYDIEIQSDGKILIGGDFLLDKNGKTFRGLARFNSNGILDEEFDIGTGFLGGRVLTVKIDKFDKILVGGDFTNFNSLFKSYFLRLNNSGGLDETFDGQGFNSFVNNIELFSDGKILVGGSFSSYKSNSILRLARFDQNGDFDTTFRASSIGSNVGLSLINILDNGKILVGGSTASCSRFGCFGFSTFLQRLEPDGIRDNSFFPLFNDSPSFYGIRDVEVDSNGKIFIVGNFINRNSNFSETRRYVSRLDENGALDESFNIGLGPNSFVFGVKKDLEGKFLIFGSFNSYDGKTRNRIARIFGEGDTFDQLAPVPDSEMLESINAQCTINFEDLTIPTATDNMDGIIQGITDQSIFPITAQGITTITWTFTDEAGNESTQTQEIILDDVTSPVPTVETLPTITGECFAEVTAPTATDNCESIIIGTTTDPTSYTEQGTFTITWTYDDRNGNTTEQTQTVIVKDKTAPIPTVETLPTITGECFAEVTAPIATDNCGGTITGTTTDPISYTEQGTYTITWTYDDGNGNISTQTQTVIVDDVTAPVPTLETLPTITGECFAEVTAPTATDNCEGTITGTITDPISYTEQGTYTITWTYEDGNGNTSTQEQTVIVDDVTDPVPTVETLPTITGECFAEVTAPTATDNCEGTMTGTTTDPISYAEQGTYTITWTFDDGNGNTSEQMQMVIVKDETAPVPTVETLPTISGECFAEVTAPTATDNCEGIIMGVTTDRSSYTEQGTFTITWTYDDGNGNTSTQTQIVIVEDVSAPVPTVETLLTITGECSAEVTAPTATDNCEGIITGTTTDPTSYTEQGTYIITWTYDDGNGNISTQTQTVIVDDVTAPVPTVETLPTITGECSAEVTAPTATDNCEGIITGTTTDPISYTEKGTYTITWTYDDGNGNISTQTQTVIVDDLTAPVPTVETLPTITGECSAEVTAPTATDNCEGTITGTTSDPISYTEQGTYTITWTYDDGKGNTSTQTQIVIVDDLTAPVPTEETLPTITGECSAEVTAPTATDNCEGTITGTTTDPISYTEQGTYTITWTYDDGNGNISTQTQTVIVDDVTAPVPTVETLPTITGECSAEVTVPTAIDNCKGIITGTTIDPTSYTEQGTYTITWTFDDGNGNTSTQIQTVIVDDLTAPVPTVETLPTISGECFAEVTAPTATDNCEGTITGTTTDPTSYTEQGTYTITWTYDDGNGNTTEQTQTVIVKDKTAPIPTVETLPTITGECFAEVTAPTATDNCEGIITGTTSDPLTYTEQGTYTITWTYDDGNGNVMTQEQKVIVFDVSNPEWSTSIGNLDRSLYCGQGDLLAQAQTLIPIPTDNCGIASVVKTSGEFVSSGPNGAGTYTNTWTAIDFAGNESTLFTQVISVLAMEVDASASGAPVQLGNSATLSASVLPAIQGVMINFYLDDVLKGSSITNSSGMATLTVSGLGLNVYKVTAEVGSGCANSVAYLPVYDPNGNFVTGGGWINSPEGALVGTNTVGKANFGFVSKYKKGSNQVDGNTEFQFNAGSLSFKSTLHEAGTLVISGKKATYRGDGSVNGVPGYRFTIIAIDGQWNGETGADQFRIKIWGSNGVLYDNGLGAADNSDVSTILGGGSIVIHEAKGKGNKRINSDLITVNWNTPIEVIQKELNQQSVDWFEGRQIPLTLDNSSYDPLTPGLYIIQASLPENEWFELDGAAQIQVLVKEKPLATDILAVNSRFGEDLQAGEKVADLQTLDPVDQIHTYKLEANEFLELRENQVIWKGGSIPAILKFQVSSTDRAGQTISKEITLTKELKIGEFLIFPNPAEDQTSLLIELDRPTEVTLRVFDATGRMVISDQLIRNETFIQTLDLTDLAAGLYTVQVQIGDMLMTGRLIKK